MTEERQLLAEYARTGSEDAFREIVRRYLGLVYSTALRLVNGDTHQAEDVSQIVFSDLARAARRLSAEVMLGGWLHRHSCYVAANVIRANRRRELREERLMEMNETEDHSISTFSRVAPELDDAINQLEEEDRAAVLLHFYEQRNFAAVGQAIGTTEDAARMRVNRALDKLHGLLKRRGITTTSAALATLLAAEAVHAVPAALITSISSLALTTTAAASTAAVASKVIAMTTLQKAAIATVLTISLGGGVFEAAQNGHLRNQMSDMRQQQVQDIAQLNGQLNDASNRVLVLARQDSKISGDANELLALRNEVGRLRAQSNELARLRQENREMVEGLNKMMQHPEQNPLRDPNFLVAIQQSEQAKKIGLYLIISASDHQNRFPSNFSELTPYMTNQNEVLPFDSFDYLAAGCNLTAIKKPAETILMRGKQITTVPDGNNSRRTKTYVYADGHANMLAEPAEGFDAWEQNHLPPVEAASAGR